MGGLRKWAAKGFPPPKKKLRRLQSKASSGVSCRQGSGNFAGIPRILENVPGRLREKRDSRNVPKVLH